MRFKQVGNKADSIAVNIRNAEASAKIPLGTPVVLKLSQTSDTQDGLNVTLPSTAGTLSYELALGISTKQDGGGMAAGDYGEAIVFGYCQSAIVLLNTRAASTDTWASVAAVASGALLGINTAGTCLQTVAGAGAQSVALPQAFLVDAIASVATAASAAITALYSTALKRVFVRML